MSKRNRLEVTVLEQEFTQAQKEQALENIGALSAGKIITELKTDNNLTATSAKKEDGTIEYYIKANVSASATPTIINADNGISAELQPDSVTYNIGLSSDFLSANALNHLSGHWESAYDTLTSNNFPDDFATKDWADNKFINRTELRDYAKVSSVNAISSELASIGTITESKIDELWNIITANDGNV